MKKQVRGRQGRLSSTVERVVTKWLNVSIFMIFPLNYGAKYTVYFSMIYSC